MREGKNEQSLTAVGSYRKKFFAKFSVHQKLESEERLEMLSLSTALVEIFIRGRFVKSFEK